MARPIKPGLDYFPCVCFPDANMEYIEAEYGTIGYSAVNKIYCKIYGGEGYFMRWTEKSPALFAYKMNADKQQIYDIVSCCLEIGIFDKAMYEKHGILTSPEIQEIYYKAKRRAYSYMNEEYLYDDLRDRVRSAKNDDKTPQNDTKTNENEAKSTQIKLNKIKPNKTKPNEIKAAAEKEKKEETACGNNGGGNGGNGSGNGGGGMAVKYLSLKSGEKLLPYVVDKINEYVKLMSENAVIHAIDEALGAGVTRWNYIEAILKRYQKEGRFTDAPNGGGYGQGAPNGGYGQGAPYGGGYGQSAPYGNTYRRNTPQEYTVKKNFFNDYEQREYADGEPEEIIRRKNEMDARNGFTAID